MPALQPVVVEAELCDLALLQDLQSLEDHIGDLLASHPLPCPAEHRLADPALSADRHQVVCLCEPGSGAAEELLHRAGCHDEGGRLLSKCTHAMLPMLPTH